MKTFTVGTIREKGDQVRRKGFTDEERADMRKAWANTTSNDPLKRAPESFFGGYDWEQTALIGVPIMASDLMHLEYRRLSPQGENSIGVKATQKEPLSAIRGQRTRKEQHV